MNIEDKVAIVTGSARGIGRAIVEKLLEKGAKGVAILDILDETGEETCKTLKAKFGQKKVVYIHCDVSSASELEAAFSNTVKNFGGLDILCNNAGTVNEYDWEKTIEVNQKSVIRGTYLAVNHMGVKNGGNGGIVINTASIAGFAPFPLIPVYSATKHAVVGFTRSAANEPNIKDNKIRVAAVCPAKVDTDFIPDGMGGCRYKEEIASVMDSMPPTPLTNISDGVMQLIESEESNGKTLYVSASETTYMEPPNIKF
ncbi:15-hydroxyprostaglandin dehydrogenase [NAD(+)]-like [Glandiceps talaboti]